MGFSFAYLKRVLPLAAAVLVAVFSAQAQRAGPGPGQSILFSSPESDTVFSNLPSLSPKPPESPDLGNTLQAPPLFGFSGRPVDMPLLPGATVVSHAETLRMQDLLDKRKNWMLLTPAEILGATTPEKILGIQEHDAAGRQKNLTALERYTERQNQLPPANTNTNAFPTWNFSDKQPNTSNSIPGGLGRPDNMANPLLNPAPNNQILAGKNGNNRWSKLFGSSSRSPVVTMQQQTNTDLFRQLLKPGSSATAALTTPSSSTAAPTTTSWSSLSDIIKISLPQTALSSGLGQSALTPVGASFTPLNDGIGKPAEMPKLPSIWSLSLTSPPSAAAWAPQPPPWLSPTPQPFTVPQRIF
jgi:hypothetical protein